MTDDTLLPDEIKKMQDELVFVLREPNHFTLEDVHHFWQDYIESTVDWSAKLRAGKSQAELAGDLVREVTRNGGLQELKEAINIKISDDKKKQNLESDICKVLSEAKIDIKKIKKCYAACLPDREREARKKIKNINTAVSHLMMYGGDYILEFLHLLRVIDDRLMSKLGKIVDKTCNYYDISSDASLQCYEKMEERKSSLLLPFFAIVLQLKEEDPDHGPYQVILRSYSYKKEEKEKKEERFESIIEAQDNVSVKRKIDLANKLSEWWEKIEPHIDGGYEDRNFIIAVPEKLLSWDIDLLKIKINKDGDCLTLSEIGSVSFCCLKRYDTPNNKTLWTDRWEEITPNHARVVSVFDHTTDEEKNEKAIKSRLKERTSGGRWASCLVEGRCVPVLSKDFLCLLDSGVPAMAWARNGATAEHHKLMPKGDFHQERLLDYAEELRKGARNKNINHAPIAFLLDHPNYRKEGILI